MFKVTESQLERAQQDFSEMAGEKIETRLINTTLYIYGSELACLRIHYKMTVGRVAFSENLNTWFYSKDMEYHHS